MPWNCRSCGEGNESDATFCGKCGVPRVGAPKVPTAYDRRADIEIAKEWCPQKGITAGMIERDLNARGEDGMTLLVYAAKALIQAGADVDAMDDFRSTALTCAAYNRNPHCAPRRPHQR